MYKTTIALALTAVLGSVSLAAADNSSFFIDRVHSDSSNLELGLVRAETSGVIEVYDYHKGEVGALLGTTTVRAGSNQDVSVDLGIRVANDVIAIMKSGDTVLATKKIDIDHF